MIDNNDDDVEVEDILLNLSKKKKRKNSKVKGKRGELQLCKLLTDRFSINGNLVEFSRVPGSGNRWSHVSQVSNDYVGDIICPKADFCFSVECKFGYEIDIHQLVGGKCTVLNEFLKQGLKDAERVNKKPLICWKQDRQDWIAFAQYKPDNIKNYIKYNNWYGIDLIDFLKQEDSIFFERSKDVQ